MENTGAMYKTPPPDDEEQEYPPQPNYPRQRRRRRAVPRQPQRVFHSDENPEIPRIKRASLFIEQQQAESVAEEEEAEEIAGEEETGASEYQTDRAARRQKIMVARRRRPPVYEPPPPPLAQRPRRTSSYRYLSAQIRNLAHNPLAVIIATFLLAVLVITPIGVYAIHAQPGVSVGNIGEQPTGTPSTGLQGITNPHEIIITPQDSDHPAPPVYATSAYLLDADSGASLYASNPFMHLAMLSTTKLMTAVLAAEQGNPDQTITITPAIERDISQLSADSSLFGIKKGESYTLRDLLYGLILVSGNDAAVAIADGLGGNIPHFVDEMNQRAQQLRLYDTHYMNPHGLLQTGQYSCAHDLAFLQRYSMSIGLIRQISGTMQYHIPQTKQHAEHFLINEDQFMWWYPGVDGGKTGHATSIYIQVVSVTRNHHHLIGVTMDTNDWWTDMRDLMNWGFDSFKWISPYDVDFQHPIPYDYLWNYFTGDKKENTIPTADKGRYYIYTGYSISGLIMAFFDKGGGLKKFGYPQSMLGVSNALIISQKFDHGTISCDLTSKQCSTA